MSGGKGCMSGGKGCMSGGKGACQVVRVHVRW